MEAVNEIKMEKYAPVRRQLKAVNSENIGHKQSANESVSSSKSTLVEVALFRLQLALEKHILKMT